MTVPPPPPVFTTAPKKRHRVRNVLLSLVGGFVVLLVVVIVIGIAVGGNTPAPTTAATPKATSLTPITDPSAVAAYKSSIAAVVTSDAAAASSLEAVPTAAPTTTKAPAPVHVRKVLLKLSGSGSTNSREFTVGSKWTIYYAFNCGTTDNPAETGNFIISADGTGDAIVSINQLAANGKSSDPEYGAGTYHLSVITECNWNAQVVG